MVAPWTVRNAIALDRFVGSRPAAARSSTPGPTCPRTGTRKRSAPGGRRTPGALRPPRRGKPAPRADPRPPRRSHLPGMEPDQALSKMGKEQLRDDISTTPASTSASSPPRSAASGPTAPARSCAPRSGRPSTGSSSGSASSAWAPRLPAPLGGPADRRRLPRGDGGQRAARGLTPPGPRPDPPAGRLRRDRRAWVGAAAEKDQSVL